MSDFSDVDASATSDSLVAYLEATDHWLGAIKSYMAATLRIGVPSGGVVVDIGCGLGHDLRRLGDAGLIPIGVDSSQLMLRRAVQNAPTQAGAVPPAVVQADAARLPFADASVEGCRIERVLQHVLDPSEVVAEIARVVKPGGVVVAFEPDAATFRIETRHPDLDDVPARLMRARHPGIGGQLEGLFASHGFRIDDVITESSRSYSLDRMPIDAESVIERAISDGRFDRASADRWLSEQRQRVDAGTFRGRYDKILVVARRQPAE